MRPGTVHSVTTLQDSIALGGHFFSAPTMRYTVYSIYHTFVGSSSVTNVTEETEQQMLLRIVLFWHHAMCDETSSSYLARISKDPEGTYTPILFSTVALIFSRQIPFLIFPMFSSLRTL